SVRRGGRHERTADGERGEEREDGERREGRRAFHGGGHPWCAGRQSGRGIGPGVSRRGPPFAGFRTPGGIGTGSEGARGGGSSPRIITAWRPDADQTPPDGRLSAAAPPPG